MKDIQFLVKFLKIIIKFINHSILQSAPPVPAQNNPVALKHFQAVQDEVYCVLGGIQFNEVKNNAAYSSVETQSTPSQFIPLHSNVAYGTSRSANIVPEYEDSHDYY